MYKITDSLARGTLPRYLRINDDKNVPMTRPMIDITTELTVTLTLKESVGLIICSLSIFDDKDETSFWLSIEIMPGWCKGCPLKFKGKVKRSKITPSTHFVNLNIVKF